MKLVHNRYENYVYLAYCFVYSISRYPLISHEYAKWVKSDRKNDIEKELLKVFQWLDFDEKILHIYNNREIISKFADYDIDDADLYNIYISHEREKIIIFKCLSLYLNDTNSDKEDKIKKELINNYEKQSGGKIFRKNRKTKRTVKNKIGGRKTISKKGNILSRSWDRFLDMIPEKIKIFFNG